MKIVAVTACPTGIAHTYMAAECLENAAKKAGHKIKVETQGSVGIENEITQKEVDEADLVILTDDIAIKRESRFKAKPIFRIGAGKCIKNAKLVIEEAIKLIPAQ